MEFCFKTIFMCYSNFFSSYSNFSKFIFNIAWATKRGFHTAKTSRPDVYRAANNILRMALDGRTICLAFYPPNYTKEKGISNIFCF